MMAFVRILLKSARSNPCGFDYPLRALTARRVILRAKGRALAARPVLVNTRWRA